MSFDRGGGLAMSHVLRPQFDRWSYQSRMSGTEQWRGPSGNGGVGLRSTIPWSGGLSGRSYSREVDVPSDMCDNYRDGSTVAEEAGLFDLGDTDTEEPESSPINVLDNEMTPRPSFTTPSAFLDALTTNEATPRASFRVCSFISTSIAEDNENSFIDMDDFTRRESPMSSGIKPKQSSRDRITPKMPTVRAPYFSPIGLTTEAFSPANFNEDFLAFDSPLRKQLLKDFHQAAYQAEVRLVLTLGCKSDRQERQQLIQAHNDRMGALMNRMLGEMAEKQRRWKATKRAEEAQGQAGKHRHRKRQPRRSRSRSVFDSDSEGGFERYGGDGRDVMKEGSFVDLTSPRASPLGRRDMHGAEMRDRLRNGAGFRSNREGLANGVNAWRFGVHYSCASPDEGSSSDSDII
ncbi:hypothetical protein HGRIS_000359 [Hohenbuehelia grisea]|uniref:Uncharacterized protein n=1 Tax=Hohenbuehelia grisea TaxID=104357 RepID=A0ABR3JST7_9AGAR